MSLSNYHPCPRDPDAVQWLEGETCPNPPFLQTDHPPGGRHTWSPGRWAGQMWRTFLVMLTGWLGNKGVGSQRRWYINIVASFSFNFPWGGTKFPRQKRTSRDVDMLRFVEIVIPLVHSSIHTAIDLIFIVTKISKDVLTKNLEIFDWYPDCKDYSKYVRCTMCIAHRMRVNFCLMKSLLW